MTKGLAKASMVEIISKMDASENSKVRATKELLLVLDASYENIKEVGNNIIDAFFSSED